MPQTRHVGCLTLDSYTPTLPLGPDLSSGTLPLSPASLTASTSLDPEPLPGPHAPSATLLAGVADAPEPPEHPDKVSSGAQQGGVCGFGPIRFSNLLWFFQSPVPGRKKSKGMKCT